MRPNRLILLPGSEMATQPKKFPFRRASITREAAALSRSACLSVIHAELPPAAGAVLEGALRETLKWAGSRQPQGEETTPSPLSPVGQQPLHGLGAAITSLRGNVHRGDSAARREVLHACRYVSFWAESRGSQNTAYLFAAACYYLRPRDAKLAIRAGRCARQLAEFETAFRWSARAIKLARYRKDGATLALAYNSLGNHLYRKGNLAKARRIQRHTLRLATRYEARDLIAAAHHDLMVIAIEARNFSDAETHGSQALASYSSGHPSVLRLANDYSCSLHLRGDYASALRLDLELLPFFQTPADQALSWGGVACAAGRLGNAKLYDRAQSAIVDLIRSHPSLPVVARAWMCVAEGGMGLKRWEAALAAAEAAFECAQLRAEGKELFDAEMLRDNIIALRDQPSAPKRAPTRKSQALVGRLVAALGVHASAG